MMYTSLSVYPNNFFVLFLIIAYQSKEAGIKTLVALDDQGEQLEKIEGGMDSINADMQIAEKALKGMELCCGVFPKFWKKTNEFKEDDAIWKGGEDGGVGGGGPPPASMSTMGPQGGYVAKITNDDREEEMEENMQQVSTMIGNLRNMAADMGNEVENQNRQLDRINLKGASNESRVKIANDRAGALLK
ncbi:synaptosomal-associated protein 25 isoform X3 [Lepeophtheirus salmonis]|uniref:synaptosomal-associated protein 25 isoform X3 n=1 Tax=Lepeophtheirus salmonis TaxID=72036 RepID=UPI001AE90000|nr:synaptosomal-associated protein 25-like isoform X3 [Lepeophtheirus salmonis]